jgi:DNA primase
MLRRGNLDLMANNLINKNIDITSEIKNRLDIVDVVSEHVVLKKSGRNYWGVCPFHNEKTPSFSVNQEKGIFKCFGCGAGGDAISFLMKINNNTFFETISDLAGKFGLEIPSFGQTSEKTELKNKIYEINLEAAKYFNKLLLESPEGIQAKEYLFKRNIDKEIIQKFTLGCSLKQADGLINHLIEKLKVSYDLLDKAGLISAKTNGNGYVDRFRNRLMIPIQDEKGNIIAFGARTLEEKQNPKYLNSPDTPVFNKSRSLFALYQAKDSIKSQDSIIIMEGYFDVITAHAHGLTNVVATLGTALTEQHIKILARYTDSRRIYLGFDADDAGINATSRGAEVIKSVLSGLGDVKQFDENFVSSSDINNRSSCEIRVVVTNTGKDPDEFIRSDGIEAYKKVINEAPLLIDYQINRIMSLKGEENTPQDKASTLKQLIPILSEIKNVIIRDEYIRLVAERLGINEESLSIEVKKSLQKSLTPRADFQQIVTKNTEKHVLAQKNLLGLYFINNDNVSILCINNYLKEVMFLEPTYDTLRQEIIELTEKSGEKHRIIDNAEELTEELLTKFADNEEIKQIIADVIFSLDDKKYLNDKLIKQYIIENITYINRHVALREQDELRSKYYANKDDELSSLQLQYKVKEIIQQSQVRLEKIND